MDYKELIEWLRDIVKHGDECPREYCTNKCGGCEACDQAADAIETLLAEREEPHGKWEYHLMPLALKCSHCKRVVTWKRKIDYNYCPYCGSNNRH